MVKISMISERLEPTKAKYSPKPTSKKQKSRITAPGFTFQGITKQVHINMA